MSQYERVCEMSASDTTDRNAWILLPVPDLMVVLGHLEELVRRRIQKHLEIAQFDHLIGMSQIISEEQRRVHFFWRTGPHNFKEVFLDGDYPETVFQTKVD